MDNKSSTSSRSPGDAEGEPVAKKSRLVFKTTIYDESIPNQWLDEPPLEIWDHHIIPLLGLRDLALSRHVCTFFEAYWQDKFSNNVLPLRVGNDVATIEDVMGVVEILSSRREYTKINPFVVLLGKGEHEITSSGTAPAEFEDGDGDEYATTLAITHSNITFIGKGKDTTTILGGFRIENLENITFKQMTVTNTSEDGIGLDMMNAKVELMDVALNKCSGFALNIILESTLVATRCEFANSKIGAGVFSSLTSATFKNCVFHDNHFNGIVASQNSTIHLHGEATASYSNKMQGINASYSGKVIIHLPTHHNTSYNNGGEDRHAGGGGTITNVED